MKKTTNLEKPILATPPRSDFDEAEMAQSGSPPGKVCLVRVVDVRAVALVEFIHAAQSTSPPGKACLVRLVDLKK